MALRTKPHTRESEHQQAAPSASRSRASSASSGLGARFATLQQRHGNRHVQSLARSAAQTCSCGGSSEEKTATLFMTDEGTETLDAHGGATTLDGDGGLGLDTFKCAVNGKFESIPTGTLPAALNSSGELGASFDMTGKFNATVIPCNCSCGEYRQYVRGYFKNNGTAVSHDLCANKLDPTTWHEDCATIGGTDYKYGYRAQAFATSKFTEPDQAGGCKFLGKDYPRLGGSTGDKLEVNLEFKGELIDTCNGNKSLASSTWKVVGSATVP
jgi:hypothetical protein